ncbi:MAG: DNA-3-methyladenine glycosylase 2 family protein [Thermoprotei archaeon]
MWDTEVELEALPPFRLDYTVWALKRRLVNLVDTFEGGVYRRVEVVGGRPVGVEVAQVGSPDEPRLTVRLVCVEPAGDVVEELVRRVIRLLGVSVDLGGFYRIAAGDPHLSALVNAFLGLKPPRFPNLFEAILNAVACQQVSLDVGLGLVSKLAKSFGERLSDARGYTYSFPQPQRVMGASVASLRALGFSNKKAEVIKAVAAAYLEGEFDERRFEAMSNAEAVRTLDAVKGIGRWSAEYVLLRGLGRLDVYPGDDVGAARSLAAWLGVDHRLSYEEVQEATAAWGRYRGMVYFHFLLRRLKEKGVVD